VPTQAIAHVKLGTEPKEIPAGPTIVSALKVLLGVPETFSLFIKDHGQSVLLGDDETVDVKSGLHFTANPGGGVS
jgi:hypothetical protein